MSRPSERQAVEDISGYLQAITSYLDENEEPNAQDGGDFLKPLLENFKGIKRISEEKVNSLKSSIELLDPDYVNSNNNGGAGEGGKRRKYKGTRKQKASKRKSRKH
jgi:hypothetical protein